MVTDEIMEKLSFARERPDIIKSKFEHGLGRSGRRLCRGETVPQGGASVTFNMNKIIRVSRNSSK